MRSHFRPQALAESQDSELGCTVRRHLAHAYISSHGSDVHYMRLLPPGDHGGQERMTSVDHTHHVDVHYLSEIFNADINKQSRNGNSGIVDQDVQRTLALLHFTGHIHHAIHIGHIKRVGFGPLVPAADLLRGCICRLFIQVRHYYPGTLFRQCNGGGPANPATGTGHQGQFVL